MSSKTSKGHRPAYMDAANELRRNKDQWSAYESTGHCVALAGPGSGKSKVLTAKFARMLSEDVKPPRGLACLTYNNECARELLRRLDSLGVRPSQNVFVGTVHSFCLQNILFPYGQLAGQVIPHPLKVATTSEQRKHFDKALGETIGVDEKPSSWSLRCSTYRRTYLDRQSPMWANQDEDAAKVIEDYEKKLRAAGLIDFEDMVLVGLQLVESQEWVRRALIARFPILVVDEYQDLGVPLHRLVLSLCFAESDMNARLFAVGDPDQSIYGFTGANPELLQQLADRDNVQSERLKLNYRSREQIVRASEIALGEKRDYKSASDAVGILEFHECPDGAHQQAAFICQAIIPRVLKSKTATTLGEIAILYRTKYEGDAIAAAVSTADYDYIRIDGNAPYAKTPLTRWLEDCAAWCGDGWRVGKPRMSAILSRWHGFLVSVTSDAARLAETRQIVAFLFEHRDANASFGEWIEAFAHECLNESLTAEDTLRDEAQLLNVLINISAEDGALSDWTIARFGGQGGSPTHINLITLHSAKGLEFDVVLMFCMDQGVIPSYRETTPASKREPRRLFYVGITRARNEVHLLYSGWRMAPWGDPIHDGPSEFLVELQNKLAEAEES